MEKLWIVNVSTFIATFLQKWSEINKWKKERFLANIEENIRAPKLPPEFSWQERKITCKTLNIPLFFGGVFMWEFFPKYSSFVSQNTYLHLQIILNQ